MSLLTLLLACRPASSLTETEQDSSWVVDSLAKDSETGGDTAELGAFDLLVSVADEQRVLRLHFADGFNQPPTTVWTWSLREDFPERDHKPHGLTVDGDTLLVTCFDYFTDAFVLRLDLLTGAVVNSPKGSGNLTWAGDPGREVLRAAHNTIRVDDQLLISDTHNHRVLALDSEGAFAWELNQETVGPDPYLRRWWSGINDVELVDGQLVVSARGDFFNHVLLFEPAQPLRPTDPPWRPVFRWPQVADDSKLLEAHNPRLIPGGFTVADSGNDRILALTWTGEEIWTLPGRGCPSNDLDLDWPRDGLMMGEVLLIADSLGDKVVAMDTAAGPCLNADTVLWTMDANGPYNLLVLPG